jgi:hypothetical protein
MNTPDRATARATAAKMISRRKRASGVSYRRRLRIELQDQAQHTPDRKRDHSARAYDPSSMYSIVTMKKIANSAMRARRPGAIAFYYDSSAGIANENEQRGTPVCRLWPRSTRAAGSGDLPDRKHSADIIDR